MKGLTVMKLIVDRITENIAVLEKDDLSHVEVDSSLLPDGAKEGSVIRCDNGVYTLDTGAEEERRKKILAKQKLIFSNRKKD